jgi:hypothetical protein
MSSRTVQEVLGAGDFAHRAEMQRQLSDLSEWNQGLIESHLSRQMESLPSKNHRLSKIPHSVITERDEFIQST